MTAYISFTAPILLKGKSYVDKTSVYENDHRSQEIIALTYNELCFLMDKYYGAPSRSEIDRTLDEYSDNTRRAKELILSDSKKN